MSCPLSQDHESGVSSVSDLDRARHAATRGMARVKIAAAVAPRNTIVPTFGETVDDVSAAMSVSVFIESSMPCAR